MLTRRMDIKNMKKLLERLAEGMKEMKTGLTEVKTSQVEMKTGLSDEIRSVQDKLTQDMKEVPKIVLNEYW